MVVDEEWDSAGEEGHEEEDVYDTYFPDRTWYVDHPFIFTACCRGQTEFIGCACEVEDIVDDGHL